jgi:hypothetical protein
LLPPGLRRKATIAVELSNAHAKFKRTALPLVPPPCASTSSRRSPFAPPLHSTPVLSPLRTEHMPPRSKTEPRSAATSSAARLRS